MLELFGVRPAEDKLPIMSLMQLSKGCLWPGMNTPQPQPPTNGAGARPAWRRLSRIHTLNSN